MKLCAGALVALLSMSVASPALSETARRTVLDRVVAVVDDDIVTLVELRLRAAPFLSRLRDTTDEGARPVAEANLYRELLSALIDERVIARFAKAQQIVVSEKEVTDAIGTVAAQNAITVDEVFRQAAAQGMDPTAYRGEIERQLLHYKVLRAVAPSAVYEEQRGRPEAELSAALEGFFKTWLEAQKQALFIEVRL